MSVATAYLEKALREETQALKSTEKETADAISRGKAAQRRLDAAQTAVAEISAALATLNQTDGPEEANG